MQDVYFLRNTKVGVSVQILARVFKLIHNKEKRAQEPVK